MTITLVRSADRVAVPWKNGAGVTAQIAGLTDTSGATLWRISVADIPGSPTTFSTFDNTDRLFTIIGDHAVRLDFPGPPARSVDIAPLTPFRFTDDGAPRCHPHGPTRALNVMARHGAAAIDVTPLTGENREVIVDPVNITGVYVVSGQSSAGDLVAQPDDFLLVDGEASTLSVTGTALLFELARH